MNLKLVLGAAASVVAMAAAALAGPDRIAFPEGYKTHFVRYATVDRPDRKPPIVRFFYVNPEALAAAVPGAALPEGTVIVMEDHKAVLGTDGQPVGDARGRFLPGDEVTNVFVQEKRAGWGADIPEALRNGDWDYAWFEPSGARKQVDPKKFERCFACHKDAAAADFNFTLSPFIVKIKG